MILTEQNAEESQWVGFHFIELFLSVQRTRDLRVYINKRNDRQQEWPTIRMEDANRIVVDIDSDGFITKYSRG